VKTIVLSGFKPFGGYPANTTQIVARNLQGSKLAGFEVQTVVFDATIPDEKKEAHRGAMLLYEACARRASGIISLGMASAKTGLCVETRAVNEISNLKYCPLVLEGTAVDNDRPLREGIELDVTAWKLPFFKAACAESLIPVMYESTDAGGFCCNHLAYQTAIARRSFPRWARIPSIFIHTPCSEEAAPHPDAFRAAGKTIMSTDQVIAALEILLRGAAI